MASAVMDTMSIDLENGPVVFRATGSKIKFPGFMKVYVEGTDDSVEEKENILPEMAKEIHASQKMWNLSNILLSHHHAIRKRDL